MTTPREAVNDERLGRLSGRMREVGQLVGGQLGTDLGALGQLVELRHEMGLGLYLNRMQLLFIRRRLEGYSHQESALTSSLVRQAAAKALITQDVEELLDVRMRLWGNAVDHGGKRLPTLHQLVECYEAFMDVVAAYLCKGSAPATLRFQTPPPADPRHATGETGRPEPRQPMLDVALTLASIASHAEPRETVASRVGVPSSALAGRMRIEQWYVLLRWTAMNNQDHELLEMALAPLAPERRWAGWIAVGCADATVARTGLWRDPAKVEAELDRILERDESAGWGRADRSELTRRQAIGLAFGKAWDGGPPQNMTLTTRVLRQTPADDVKKLVGAALSPEGSNPRAACEMAVGLAALDLLDWWNEDPAVALSFVKWVLDHGDLMTPGRRLIMSVFLSWCGEARETARDWSRAHASDIGTRPGIELHVALERQAFCDVCLAGANARTWHAPADPPSVAAARQAGRMEFVASLLLQAGERSAAPFLHHARRAGPAERRGLAAALRMLDVDVDLGNQLGDDPLSTAIRGSRDGFPVLDLGDSRALRDWIDLVAPPVPRTHIELLVEVYSGRVGAGRLAERARRVLTAIPNLALVWELLGFSRSRWIKELGNADLEEVNVRELAVYLESQPSILGEPDVRDFLNRVRADERSAWNGRSHA